MSQSDQDTQRDLDKVIKELKEMKRTRRDQQSDQKADANPKSSKIRSNS